MSDRMIGVLLGSQLRVKAIGWLFSHPDQEFYITQIATATGLPVSNLSLELKKLASVGLLEDRRVGGQHYYRANASCPIFDELKGVALKTSGLADTLSAAVRGLSGVEVAFIYGSIPRGDAQADSDVDLMVIGNTSFADVIAALEGARERVGRDINPCVYKAAEFREKALAGAGFLSDVIRREKIFLVGDQGRLNALVT